MRSPFLSRAVLLFLFFALSRGFALAEVPNLKVDQLDSMAAKVIDGKLARIYTTLEKEGDWEFTRSVAEIQVSKVEKGKFEGKLAYVRFWHKRFIGKGKSPLGAFGQREIPAVGSEVRAYVRDGEDGGLDVISPNGLKSNSATAKETK
jgi:hypothetical protein